MTQPIQSQHFHWIDYALVVVPLIFLIMLALRTRRYVRGASDFIAAGRCAGRYLLANAKGEAGSGVTNTVSYFEKFMVSGFVLLFWEKLTVPVALFLAVSGFVAYRYRETRCLTFAQFFEMRYSKGFRIYMGCAAFLAGILNFGIFPAVSARFFIYFLGLHEYEMIWGVQVPLVPLFMGIYLAVACSLIFFGGQVTLIVTDCVEGILTHAVYIVVILVLFSQVSWHQVLDVLTGAVPAGATPETTPMAIRPNHSLVDPFDAFGVADFNTIYVFLGLFSMVYGHMSWQGGHGFNAAARTPHEGRMGNVLGQWRQYARTLVLLVLVICTVTFLRHPDFAAQAAPVKQEIVSIPEPGTAVVQTSYADRPHMVAGPDWAESKAVNPETGRKDVPKVQQQQAVSVGLRHLLPTGVKGLFLLIMILGLFAGDGSHVISWSSIFIQDVVLPLRGGRPLSPRAHVNLLRAGAIGCAAFAFFFSWLVKLQIPIWMWWAITGAIYNAGAGAVIIAGLYWRRGTAAGAWTAMILGTTLSLTAIFSKMAYPAFFAELSKRMPSYFDLGNESWQGFFIMLTCAGSYVIVSLLTCKEPVDMDRLLHRGKYRIADDHVKEADEKKVPLLHRLVGIDSAFTRPDKFVAGFIFWWSMFCVVLNVGMVIWHYTVGMAYPDLQMDKRAWGWFWLVYGLVIPFAFAVITLVWFGIGGVVDLKAFFRDLAAAKHDVNDDGVVRREAGPGSQPIPAAVPAEQIKDQLGDGSGSKK